MRRAEIPSPTPPGRRRATLDVVGPDDVEVIDPFHAGVLEEGGDVPQPVGATEDRAVCSHAPTTLVVWWIHDHRDHGTSLLLRPEGRTVWCADGVAFVGWVVLGATTEDTYARSIWTGAISFGLVTVPCSVLSATEDHSIRFHQYHLEDGGRVRVRKFCELEDREVASSEIGKGYEVTPETKGHAAQIVPISDEELRNLPLPTAKAIEIEAFVPAEDIDPIQIGEGYYLQASGQVAAKPYRLLVEALGRSDKVAIAKYAWSGRERLGMLRVRDDGLVLHAMRWPDEIRSPAELLPPEVSISEEEMQGALSLMESMSVEDLGELDAHDEYTQAMAQIIEAKREDRPMPQTPEPEEPTQVLDLMAALNASVAKARESRGEQSDHADVHELPAPKKTAAKKTAGKKPPAGKTAAKKTVAKKTARRPRSA